MHTNHSFEYIDIQANSGADNMTVWHKMQHFASSQLEMLILQWQHSEMCRFPVNETNTRSNLL